MADGTANSSSVAKNGPTNKHCHPGSPTLSRSSLCLPVPAFSADKESPIVTYAVRHDKWIMIVLEKRTKVVPNLCSSICFGAKYLINRSPSYEM